MPPQAAAERAAAVERVARGDELVVHEPTFGALVAFVHRDRVHAGDDVEVVASDAGQRGAGLHVDGARVDVRARLEHDGTGGLDLAAHLGGGAVLAVVVRVPAERIAAGRGDGAEVQVVARLEHGDAVLASIAYLATFPSSAEFKSGLG
ncbi:MAG: hypothetical protein JWQ61_897 [Collimonas fungivorans]|nr:hypothetical protein [Collimonas fungivorans]